MMATAVERKFTSLRKRLDQLGYRQPLGIEALPLVEKLFSDLLHTTESLKGAKQQLGKHKEQKVVWEQHVEPYKTDNARLVKENNELHQQLIHKKESSELRVRELKASLRRLEHENADLKFLNTQYMQKLRSQEKESQAKTDKILELQEKNFQAVIQTPGGKKKHIPFRRQRMDIDSTLPESSHTPLLTTHQPLPSPDPYVVDLLHVADQRMADMQAALEHREKEHKKLEQSLQFMRKQVETRESEVERLTGLLKGGRPPEALAAEGARQSNERMVAHLNIQVDFLQQANHELEGKLSSSESVRVELEHQSKQLEEKNSRICSELQEISELVKQMESEREGGETELRENIEQLKVSGVCMCRMIFYSDMLYSEGKVQVGWHQQRAGSPTESASSGQGGTSV